VGVSSVDRVWQQFHTRPACCTAPSFSPPLPACLPVLTVPHSHTPPHSLPSLSLVLAHSFMHTHTHTLSYSDIPHMHAYLHVRDHLCSHTLHSHLTLPHFEHCAYACLYKLICTRHPPYRRHLSCGFVLTLTHFQFER
jgi:hypothetical protein